jgi:glycosyltransferase involved in cell wall biosynthesis
LKRDLTPPTIAFLPDYSIANAYALRMQEILASFGRIEKLRIKSRVLGLCKGGRRRVDLVVVNWEENALISKRTRRVSVCGVITLLLKVAAMKLIARRMAFIRHNHYPHATRPSSAALALWLVDRYEGLFDFVFVHSGAELARRSGTAKRHYLPHPLYRKLGDTATPDLTSDLPERYFVVLGRIAAYKYIDRLMSSFPASQKMVVCGEVGNSDYAAELAQIKRPNVIYRPGYMSEATAQAVVTRAAAVVIAHAGPSTIVSGTFFYALSLQRPVFAVRTPFLDWIAPRLRPGIVTLAEDMEHLCRLIENSTCAPFSEESGHIVQREFGDEAVRSALAIAFDPRSRPRPAIASSAD